VQLLGQAGGGLCGKSSCILRGLCCVHKQWLECPVVLPCTARNHACSRAVLCCTVPDDSCLLLVTLAHGLCTHTHTADLCSECSMYCLLALLAVVWHLFCTLRAGHPPGALALQRLVFVAACVCARQQSTVSADIFLTDQVGAHLP
jgi:hypothetical protein